MDNECPQCALLRLEASLALSQRDDAYKHGWDDGYKCAEKLGNAKASVLRIERDILQLALDQKAKAQEE